MNCTHWVGLVFFVSLVAHSREAIAQDPAEAAPVTHGTELPQGLPAPVSPLVVGSKGDALMSRRYGATQALERLRNTISQLEASEMLSKASALQLAESCEATQRALDAADGEPALAAVEVRVSGVAGLVNGMWVQALEHRAASADSAVEELRDQLSAAPGGVAKARIEQTRIRLADLKQQIGIFRAQLVSRDPGDLLRAQRDIGEVTAAVAWLQADAKLVMQSTVGNSLVDTLLQARCRTAICFDNGEEQKYWLGIEPIVELPVGKSFGVGRSSLADYVNNHELRVDLAAGLRVWFFRDVFSVSVYISKALTDASVRIEGSPFVYPGSAVKRPYPGLALGLFYDSLWVGFDRDELRNGDADDQAGSNPDFPPNELVSATWTVTLALQPVTAFRAAIGTAVESSTKSRAQGAQ